MNLIGTVLILLLAQALLCIGDHTMAFETTAQKLESPAEAKERSSHARLQDIGYSHDLALKKVNPSTEPTFLTMTNPFEAHDQSKDVQKSSETAAFPQLKDLSERINNAQYPRIGQAWAPADNLPGDSESAMAKHDLYFGSISSFGFKWKQTKDGESDQLDEGSIKKAADKRERLLEKNPNMVMLAEIRYHDGQPNMFPANSGFWEHQADGHRIKNPDYKQFDLFDYANPKFQDHVAAQAKAALQSGAVDGVMLDWFHEGKGPASDQAKLALLHKVRDAVGPDALIMINTNETTMPKEATSLVNGYYMESANTKEMNTPAQATKEWKQIQDTLDYAEKNGRSPHINMVETWWEKGSTDKRNELDKMRATTTMVMTHSDGYALFADPDNNGKSQDHAHNWYQFWNADVGRPLGGGTARGDGSCERQFQNGTVLSNATGDEKVSIRFAEDRRRASSGELVHAGETADVGAHDGEIFLKTK
jgi:hypothetical protein